MRQMKVAKSKPISKINAALCAIEDEVVKIDDRFFEKRKALRKKESAEIKAMFKKKIAKQHKASRFQIEINNHGIFITVKVGKGTHRVYV